jgi:nitrite reductase/ring-hydroxylating ferredoxin subunit
MKTEDEGAPKPDLAQGIDAASVADGGMLLGRVGDEDVVVARVGNDWFAVGAKCTHYRGPLAEGLLVGDTVRCPLHHACFSLRTGEALRAPAFDPIACWRVDREGDRVFVREKLPQPQPAASSTAPAHAPSSVIIVGGGAAGSAAADMLKREGYNGPIAIINADADPPVDRPNLSKDYLAGEAQDDWIPVWSAESYAERGIDLILERRVTAIDPAAHAVLLDDGSRREFGALLIATGADPVRLPIAGRRQPERALSAILRRQPCDCRENEIGEARGRRRRQLHRPGGRRLAAASRHFRRRRGAGSDTARKDHGRRGGTIHPVFA